MFLQFGALIPLGIYAATAATRLRFLGVNAAGPYIALFGGLMTVFDSAADGFIVRLIPKKSFYWKRVIVF
jgi:hypothetical protein